MTDDKDPTAIEIDPVEPWENPLVRHLTGWTSHGNFRIDMPFITEIAPNLYHGGVKTGLVLPEDILHVLSLYKWEEYEVRHKLLSKLTVEMYDATDQDLDGVDELAEWVNNARKTGPVLVHCQAGLNRSSLVVAKALLLSGEAENGPQAIDMIRTARSEACLCNPAFEAWVAAQ
jgi:protein-tyrosine phosphatase